MKKLIIFDLDGTLLYTLPDMKNSMNYLFKQLNGNPITIEDMHTGMTKGRRYLIEKSLDRKITDEENIKYQTIYNDYYFLNKNILTKPYEGVVELLEKLKRDGYLLAVCSNKLHEATSGLIKEIFPSVFDYVLGRSDKHKSKPNKEMIDYIIKKLNVDKSNVIYIGDTQTDMKAATSAVVYKIAVLYGFGSKESLLKYQPNAVVNQPKEIYEIIINYFI